MTHVYPSECQERMTRLQARLPEHELDAFIVSSRDSMFYLTGVVCDPLERPLFLVLRRHGTPLFVVPALERDHLASAIDGSVPEVYWEYPGPPGETWGDRLQAVLGGVGKIGVEPSLRREVADELTDRHVHTMPLVEELRKVKSSAEVKLIRRAAKHADLGVERLLASSYRGSSVAEGFAETRSVMKRIIRQSEAFNPLLSKVLMGTWAAPRSAQPHSIPKLEDLLGKGPHVALVLVTVDGYAAECERTYFTTRPSSEERQVFGVMMEARRIALQKIRPGVPCADVDVIVKEFLEKEGYRDKLLHRTGHGIGIAYHAEAPWLAEGSDEVLAPGMVVSVEPGIYLPEVGGFRHSDTVVVTDDGSYCLTSSETDIDELTITAWKPWTRLKGWLVRRSLGVKPKPASSPRTVPSPRSHEEGACR